MGSPFFGELLHCGVIGKTFEPVDCLEAFADAEVARGKDVGAVEREYEEHVHRPDADALDLHEVLQYFCARHFVQMPVPDSSIREFFGEVFYVRRLLSRKACGTQFLNRYRAHGFRLWKSA